MNHKHLKNIVFDLGGVLIDWNPRYLFTEVFENKDELDYFLSEICSSDWNEEQDGGRSNEEATRVLALKFPNYQDQIQLYYNQWERMLGGALEENVQILHQVAGEKQFRIFALTNWSAETFPIALKRFDFLRLFDDILVSGVEKMRKPQLSFYRLMFNRFNIKPEETLFIDDNHRNILAAESLGIACIHLPPGKSLKGELEKYQLYL